MKKLIIICFILLLCGTAETIELKPIRFAKSGMTRMVSGIVIDTARKAIIGARLTLTSKSDSLNAVTNNDGMFTFENVKQASFTISVMSARYLPFVSNYSFSEIAKKLVLPQITLKAANFLDK